MHALRSLLLLVGSGILSAFLFLFFNIANAHFQVRADVVALRWAILGAIAGLVFATVGLVPWRDLFGRAVSGAGRPTLLTLMRSSAWQVVSVPLFLASFGFWIALASHQLGALGSGVAAVGGGLTGILGLWCNQRGKKILASAARTTPADDPRPPVLYLRSFRDDVVAAKAEAAVSNLEFLPAESEEEQLALVLSAIGPVSAVGRPGERLPELGARRLYVENDRWRETVTELMRRSALVVLRAGSTPGLWWELEQAAALVPPERLVLLVALDRAAYAKFRLQAQPLLRAKLPDYRAGKERCGSLTGFVYFNAAGAGQFAPFVHPGLRTLFMQPAAPRFQLALRPVFEQLGVPWRPPALNWVVIGFVAFVLLSFVVVLAAFRKH